MMNNRCKRFFSLLLALVMVVSAFPITVFADNEEILENTEGISDEINNNAEELFEEAIPEELPDHFADDQNNPDLFEADAGMSGSEGGNEETEMGIVCNCLFADAIPDVRSAEIIASWIVFGMSEEDSATVGVQLYHDGEEIFALEKDAEYTIEDPEYGTEISLDINLASEEDCILEADTEYEFDVCLSLNGEKYCYSDSLVYDEETEDTVKAGRVMLYTLPDFEALEAEMGIPEAETEELEKNTDDTINDSNEDRTETETLNEEKFAASDDTVGAETEATDEKNTEENISEDVDQSLKIIDIPENADLCDLDSTQTEIPETGVQVIFTRDPENTVIKLWTKSDWETDPVAALPLEPKDDGSYSLLPGEYIWSAELEGYEKREKEVLIVGEQNCTVEVSLLLLSSETNGFGSQTAAKCGDSLEWYEDEAGNLYISGTGYMYDDLKWSDYFTSIKKIYVQEGVTEISYGVFENCFSLEFVELPESLKTIGGSAFMNCTSLTSVDFKEGLESIESFAFRGCTALECIELPTSLITIGRSAFSYCSSLITADIKEGVESIGPNAFSNCSSFESIVLPRSLKEAIWTGIEDSFFGCPLVFTVPSNSWAELSVMKYALPYVVDGDAPEADFALIDMTGTSFSIEESGKDGSVSISVDYVCFEGTFDQVETPFIYFKLPESVSVDNSNVKINGQNSKAGCIDSDGFFSLPLSTESGSVSFSLCVPLSEEICIYAFVDYQKENEQFQEVLFNESITTYTLTFSAVNSGNTIRLSGSASGNAAVDLYLENSLLSSVLPADDGTYSFTYKYENWAPNTGLSVSAVCGGEKRTIPLYYKIDAPVVLEMIYYDTESSTQGIDLLESPVIEYSGSTEPMKFVVRLDNSDAVKYLSVVGYINGNKYSIPAEYDEESDTFVAIGYFIDAKTRYLLPDRITIEYDKSSRTERVIDGDIEIGAGSDIYSWILDCLPEITAVERPDLAEDNETKYLIELPSGTDQSDVKKAFEYSAKALDAASGLDLYNTYTNDLKYLSYVIPGLNDEKYLLALDWSDPQTVSALLINQVAPDGVDLVKSVVDYKISLVDTSNLNASGKAEYLKLTDASDALSRVSDIISVIGDTYDIIVDTNQLKQDVNKIEDEYKRAEALEKIEELEGDRIAFSLMSTILPLVVVASGGTMAAPVFLFSAMIGAIGLTSDYFVDQRVAGIMNEGNSVPVESNSGVFTRRTADGFEHSYHYNIVTQAYPQFNMTVKSVHYNLEIDGKGIMSVSPRMPRSDELPDDDFAFAPNTKYLYVVDSVTVSGNVTEINADIYDPAWAYDHTFAFDENTPDAVYSIPLTVEHPSVCLPSTVRAIQSGSIPDVFETSGPGADLDVNWEVVPEGAYKGLTKLKTVDLSGGKTVRIGANAFSGCTALETVYLPNTLEEIGESAFANCTSLLFASIPSTVKVIRSRAFYNCSSLIGAVTLEKTCIGNQAFSGCASLSSVSLSGVIFSEGYWGSGAFSGCEGLVSADLSGYIEEIPSEAFYGCSSLESVSLPASLMSIYSSAFKNCSSLTELKMSDKDDLASSFILTLYSEAFSGCESLLSFDLECFDTLSIGYQAFENCKSLETVKADSIYSAGQEAFYGDEKLSLIEGTIEFSIGNSAFKGCSSLVAVTILGCCDIGESAFENCSALERVTVLSTAETDPSSIKTWGSRSGGGNIESSAFLGCASLKKMDLSNSLGTAIEEKAFENCSELTEIVFPVNLLDLRCRFEGCTAVSTVRFTSIRKPDLDGENYFPNVMNAQIYCPEEWVNEEFRGNFSSGCTFRLLKREDTVFYEEDFGSVINDYLYEYDPRYYFLSDYDSRFILQSQLNEITAMRLNKWGGGSINYSHDLYGIEHFENLETLEISSDFELCELDLEKLTKLKNFSVVKQSCENVTGGKFLDDQNHPMFYIEPSFVVDPSRIVRVSEGTIDYDKGRIVFDKEIEQFSYFYQTGFQDMCMEVEVSKITYNSDFDDDCDTFMDGEKYTLNPTRLKKLENTDSYWYAYENYKVTDDCTIASGSSLYLGGILYMGGNSTLTIDKGGELIIDGGTLIISDHCKLINNGSIVLGYGGSKLNVLGTYQCPSSGGSHIRCESWDCVILNSPEAEADASWPYYSGYCFGMFGENVSWEFENGRLSISGNGPTDASRNTDEYSWQIAEKFTTSVEIFSGITAVPSGLFANFSKIEKAVFYGLEEEIDISSVGNSPLTSKLKFTPLIRTITVMNGESEQPKETFIDVQKEESDTITLSVKVFPENTESSVIWTSSNEKVAVVKDGRITFKGLGTVEIIVAADDIGEACSSVIFKRQYIDPADVLTAELSSGIGTMTVGETSEMVVRGNDEISSEYLSFYSDNPDIVTISENGMVTAKAPGIAVVKAALKKDPSGRFVSFSISVAEKAADKLHFLDEDENVIEALSYDISETAASGMTRILTVDGSLPLTDYIFKTTDAKIAKLALSKSKQQIILTVQKGITGLCMLTAEPTAAALKKNPALQGTAAELQVKITNEIPSIVPAKITLNSWLSAGAVVNVVQNPDNKVTDVGLLEKRKDKNYYYQSSLFEVTDFSEDGTATIKARNTEIKNQTAQAYLRLSCENGKSYLLPLTINVKNTMPAVTLKQLKKLDLFRKDSSAEFSFECKNGTVSTVEFYPGLQCSFSGEYSEGILRVVDNGFRNNSKIVNGKLRIWLDGYDVAMIKELKVATETKLPALKLSSASGTVYPSEESSVTVEILNKTGEKAEIDENSVTVSGPNVQMISQAGNVIRIGYTGNKKSSAEIKIQNKNWTKPVVLKYSISVSSALPTAKPKLSTLKLNALYETSAETPLIFSSANVSVKDSVLMPTGKTVTDALTVECVNGKIIASVVGESIPAKGTYSYSFTPELKDVEGMVALKPVTVKVNVSAVKAAVSLKASGSMDLVQRESSVILWKASLKNISGEITGVSLNGADGDAFEAKVRETGEIELRFIKDQIYAVKSYKVQPMLTVVSDDGITESITASVQTVSVKQSSLKAVVAEAVKEVSQQQTKAVTFTVSIDSPLGSRIGEIKLGKIESLFQKNLAVSLSNISWDVASDGRTVNIHIVAKNMARFTAGKTYTVPVMIIPEGSVTEKAAATVKLSMKII